MAYIVPETHQPCKGDRKELPNGLRELATLSEVLVSRNVNVCEVFLCCTPRQASFSIYTTGTDQDEILSIKESGMCVFRECIGAARNLNLRMSNSDDENVATFYRTMTCSRGCCYSPGPPSMAVNSPPHIRLGKIEERVTCCNPIFDVLPHKENEPTLTYTTNCCYMKTCNWCTDVEIQAYDPATDNLVAKIIKNSKSDGAELFNLKNDFLVEFLTDLDIVKKLMVLGACLLVDFNNFEHDRRFCC
ncbi:phospholipid scramblase 1-like [Mytilus galloprovincialis]|uniref:phospholipid scramblase 1-like n=1 Tax=Mytilus galloprovincialis TaxID=29158 RepID=UPI003F7CA300